MRAALGLSVLVVLLGFVAACGDASTSKIAPKLGGGGPGDEEAEPRSGRIDDVLDENDGGTIVGDEPNTPAPGDDDGDGVPNAEDCDPNSKALKKRFVEDSLGTDKGLFAVAPGFPTASWTFTGAAAYRQIRLADAADVSFYANDSQLSDVQVEVTAASAEVSNAFTPRLRQIFVVVGATSAGGTFSGHGCGIEVVQGETPEQRTTIVKLSGSPTAVTSTVIQRVSRPAVQVNEDFGIKMRFSGGAMVCDVVQPSAPGGSVTTQATANNLGALVGSVGLYTRQTKGIFKNIRVCGVK